MNSANSLMILGALLTFSASSANAGPCNTLSRDAGSGNVPGYVGQTTGSSATDSKQLHPPTSAMNKATENIATSSEDVKREMQSKPTGAEQSQQTQPSQQNQPAPSGQSQKMTAGSSDAPRAR